METECIRQFLFSLWEEFNYNRQHSK